MKMQLGNRVVTINGNEKMDEITFLKTFLDFLETHKNELTNDELKLKEMLV